MKAYKYFQFLLTAFFFIGVYIILKQHGSIFAQADRLYPVLTQNDVVLLFPKTVSEIKDRTARFTIKAKKAIDTIIAIPNEKRTFSNTAQALDKVTLLSDLAITGRAVSILELVSPDASIRKTAHDEIVKMTAFSVDNVTNNRELYLAFKAYVDENSQHELLTAEQHYYLQETMDDFKRNGLNLPKETQVKISRLKKELALLSQDFQSNIATDNRTITTKKEDLKGLDTDFINSLKQTESGDYIIGVDYPTYFNIMENCAVENTRKRLFLAFSNRAYPKNNFVLKKVIEKRDKLAQLVGFNSYADLDLSNQMIDSVEKAELFLNDLIAKSTPKVQKEFEQLTTTLPSSVSLTADGKLKPWDIAFLKSSYKKKVFSLDERTIAEYFPMKKTIDGLLAIYEQFFNLTFKEKPLHDLWHNDLQLIEVYNAANDNRIGYIIIDLYPRPNKYSHACHASIVPSFHTNNAKNFPSVSLVIANFSKPTDTKPSLLKRSDVRTFFHEFGHALHSILGRTALASFSGTNTKRDFVEMPSQMLEEWLFDEDILKKISCHYKTGKPLPDETIDTIISLKHFDSGQFVQAQSFYSMLSLHYYKAGSNKDTNAIFKNLYTKIRTHVQFEPKSHMQASFGHLMGYGAKYYGYLWSKVYALDLFYEIKKHGLLNPEIGQRYIKEILGKGGSVDPIILLRNFLNREPNSDAFFSDLGL